MKGFYIF